VASKRKEVMDGTATRSSQDLSQVAINSLLLTVTKEGAKEKSEKRNEELNTTQSVDEIVEDTKASGENVSGHDLDDQKRIVQDTKTPTIIQQQLRTISKFNGQGSPEQWLKNVIENIDVFELSEEEANKLIPKILTGDALIWYSKHHEEMPTFLDFMKRIIQHFGVKDSKQAPTNTVNSQQLSQGTLNESRFQESVIESIQNKMLTDNFVKLRKFTGRSKESVSKWLREFQQAIQPIKLSDEKKIFFAGTCLEAEAKDWFFDNRHLFSSWTMFLQKLTTTFESSNKADIAFNRLRHYEQGIHQDVQQYYFEILKLCHDTNASMDAGTKLQYLKDGLKPSLRFDVLVRDPKTPEEFLEYAKKVEELKSLDEKQMNTEFIPERKFEIPARIDKKPFDINRQPNKSINAAAAIGHEDKYYGNDPPRGNSSERKVNFGDGRDRNNDNVPKPPYRCYKCGDPSHFIKDCPNFQ
jgi:hypothetical protein